MTLQGTQRADEGFVQPGLIKVSPSALELASNLGFTVRTTQRGDHVVIFDWALAVKARRGPNEPWEDIGDCLGVGAMERAQVPQGFTQILDGLEFAIRIPKDVWEKSTQRLIDTDPTKFFKLTLR